MKGFKKDGKFHPTGNKKSALKINDCVSRKIPKLRHEGKPQKQSIAIAESMCRNKQSLDKKIREKHSFFESNGSEVDEAIKHQLEHEYVIDGKEVSGENINRLSTQEIVLNRVMEMTKTIGLDGLDIKGKRDFDNVWGFSFYLLRELEREGKVKIRKIGNSPFAINISRGDVELKKKYTMDDVIE